MRFTNRLWKLITNQRVWFFAVAIALSILIIDSNSRGIDWSSWAAEPQDGGWTVAGRSLWDWMGALLAISVGAMIAFLNQKNAVRSAQVEMEVAAEVRMDKMLDDYLQTMTDFLLNDKTPLLSVKPDHPKRGLARTQTITTIKRLDEKRNKILFNFLQESKLIQKRNLNNQGSTEEAIISFAYADLRGASLSGVNLEGADLRGAFLMNSNLSRAYLKWTNLYGADLTGANLKDAKLRGANLAFAHLSNAELGGAQLTGTTMPDGEKWSPEKGHERYTAQR